MHVEFPYTEIMPNGEMHFLSQTEEPPAGYAYMLQSGDSNEVKIGWVQKSVAKRRNALQVGNPKKLKILATWPTSTPKRLEKGMKAHFAAYRIHGEWFVLPDQVFAMLNSLGA